MRLARAVHTEAGYTLNLPTLRWVAVPIALAGLFVRRWEWAVLSGSAAFVTFLFLDTWASHSYWLAVLPLCTRRTLSWRTRFCAWPGRARRG